jgi:hypothetical protein
VTFFFRKSSLSELFSCEYQEGKMLREGTIHASLFSVLDRC